MRHAAYAVTTAEGARAAVQELALRKVRFVKTWVDDRGGTIKKLTPDALPRDHRRGTRTQYPCRRARHATRRRQGSAARRRRRVRTHDQRRRRRAPRAVQTAPEHGRADSRSVDHGATIYAPWLNPPHPLVVETVSPEQIKRLQDRLAAATADEIERGRQAWARLARGIARLNAAGVRIGVGDRRRRTDRRSVRRLDDAHGNGEYGRGWHDAGARSWWRRRGRPRRFSGSTISAWWRQGRAPTSSCSTPIRWTTSRIREESAVSTCAGAEVDRVRLRQGFGVTGARTAGPFDSLRSEVGEKGK